jgi:uncharacterized membrane protein YdjX (TVP38/TMEM64 family)
MEAPREPSQSPDAPRTRRRRASLVDIGDDDELEVAALDVQLAEKPKTTWDRVKQGLGVLVLLCIVGGYLQYGHLLTMDALMENQKFLRTTVGDTPIVSSAIFIVLMMGVVALSLPGATLFCFVSGLAFPQPLACILAWLGFSFGSALCYILVQTVLGDYFKGKLRASPQLFKYYGKFQTYLLDENSSQAVPMICIRYLLFIPHWFTNVAAPLIGVPFFLFLWTTMLSSIPGTALYTCAGAGLATVFEDRERALAAGEAAEMPSTMSVLLAVVLVEDPVEQLVVVGFVSLFVIVPALLYYKRGLPAVAAEDDSKKPLPGMSPQRFADQQPGETAGSSSGFGGAAVGRKKE